MGPLAPGGVVEWLMAPVLKTGDPQGSVGSNPTPSAPCNPFLLNTQDWRGLQRRHQPWP